MEFVCVCMCVWVYKATVTIKQLRRPNGVCKKYMFNDSKTSRDIKSLSNAKIQTNTYVQALDQWDFSGMHFSENLHIGRLQIRIL